MEKYNELLIDKFVKCGSEKPTIHNDPYRGHNSRDKIYGAYIIRHTKSGMIYCGSSSNVASRKNGNLSRLRRGNHNSKKLQEVYNLDPNVEFLFILTDDRNSAHDLEQRLIDKYVNSGLLCNSELNSRSSIGIKRSEETKRLVGLSGLGRVPFNKGKSLDPTHLKNVLISRKKLFRKISIDGIVYPSLTDATKQLNLSIGCVGRRLQSETKTYRNWFYL